jgi:hypothetical protein
LDDLQILPGFVLVAELEDGGEENLGEDFDRVHDARPWAVEVLIAVGEVNLLLPDGAE